MLRNCLVEHPPRCMPWLGYISRLTKALQRRVQSIEVAEAVPALHHIRLLASSAVIVCLALSAHPFAPGRGGVARLLSRQQVA